MSLSAIIVSIQFMKIRIRISAHTAISHKTLIVPFNKTFFVFGCASIYEQWTIIINVIIYICRKLRVRCIKSFKMPIIVIIHATGYDICAHAPCSHINIYIDLEWIILLKMRNAIRKKEEPVRSPRKEKPNRIEMNEWEFWMNRSEKRFGIGYHENQQTENGCTFFYTYWNGIDNYYYIIIVSK